MKFLSSVALLLAALPSTAAPPDRFVTAKDARYPLDRYIVAAAQGHDRAEARRRAFADIGAQIDTHLVSSATVRTSTHSEKGVAQVVRDVTREIVESTTFDAEGLAEVADTYAEAGVTYVFAVLDRARAAQRYLDEADRASAEVNIALNSFAVAEAEKDLRAMSELARKVAEPAKQIGRRLALADAISKVPASGDRWTRVEAARGLPARVRAARAGLEIEVCIDAAPDFPEGAVFVAGLLDHLVALGAVARACGHASAPLRLRLHGQVSATFVDEPRLGAVFCKPTATLFVDDGRTKKPILKTVIGGETSRAGGRDRAAASQAALRLLHEAATATLAEVIGE